MNKLYEKIKKDQENIHYLVLTFAYKPVHLRLAVVMTSFDLMEYLTDLEMNKDFIFPCQHTFKLYGGDELIVHFDTFEKYLEHLSIIDVNKKTYDDFHEYNKISKFPWINF